jgi:hypothetical protein
LILLAMPLPISYGQHDKIEVVSKKSKAARRAPGANPQPFAFSPVDKPFRQKNLAVTLLER